MIKKIATLACLSGIALTATILADGDVAATPSPSMPREPVGRKAPAPKLADKEMDGSDMQKSDMNDSNLYSGGFTLGTAFNIHGGGTDAALAFGYIDKMFLFDVSVGYSHQKLSGFKAQNPCDIHAHLGMRTRLYQNLFVTYGVVGSVTVGDLNTSGRPYTAGVFAGLDLQLTRHFLLSGKIDPYLYERPMKGSKTNDVFSTGTITLSYVF